MESLLYYLNIILFLIPVEKSLGQTHNRTLSMDTGLEWKLEKSITLDQRHIYTKIIFYTEVQQVLTAMCSIVPSKCPDSHTTIWDCWCTKQVGQQMTVGINSTSKVSESKKKVILHLVDNQDKHYNIPFPPLPEIVDTSTINFNFNGIKSPSAPLEAFVDTWEATGTLHIKHNLRHVYAIRKVKVKANGLEICDIDLDVCETPFPKGNLVCYCSGRQFASNHEDIYTIQITAMAVVDHRGPLSIHLDTLESLLIPNKTADIGIIPDIIYFKVSLTFHITRLADHWLAYGNLSRQYRHDLTEKVYDDEVNVTLGDVETSKFHCFINLAVCPDQSPDAGKICDCFYITPQSTLPSLVIWGELGETEKNLILTVTHRPLQHRQRLVAGTIPAIGEYNAFIENADDYILLWILTPIAFLLGIPCGIVFAVYRNYRKEKALYDSSAPESKAKSRRPTYTFSFFDQTFATGSTEKDTKSTTTTTSTNTTSKYKGFKMFNIPTRFSMFSLFKPGSSETPGTGSTTYYDTASRLRQKHEFGKESDFGKESVFGKESRFGKDSSFSKEDGFIEQIGFDKETVAPKESGVRKESGARKKRGSAVD